MIWHLWPSLCHPRPSPFNPQFYQSITFQQFKNWHSFCPCMPQIIISHDGHPLICRQKERVVNRLRIYIACLYLLVICVIGASAEPNKPVTSALPMQLTTAGSTQVILHDMDPTDHRITLEIRSPDITSMPAKSAVRLAFDTQITHVTQPHAPMPLALETAVAGKHVTFFLARDPFAFPQPWAYTVTIVFNRLPRTGVIATGDTPPQDVTYPTLLSTVQAAPGT